MDDKAFFAELLRAFKLTTKAETAYWEPEEHGKSGVWSVWAVSKDDRTVVAVGLEEADAQFIAGLHGALPDLVRRLNHAVDEAEAADLRADEAMHRLLEGDN